MEFFNLLGTVIKTTFASGIVLLVATGGILAATKPTEDMLVKQVNSELAKKSTSVGQSILTRGIASIAMKTSTFDTKDYFIVKVCDVTLATGHGTKFIGIFQNWYEIPK